MASSNDSPVYKRPYRLQNEGLPTMESTLLSPIEKSG